MRNTTLSVACVDNPHIVRGVASGKITTGLHATRPCSPDGTLSGTDQVLLIPRTDY